MRKITAAKQRMPKERLYIALDDCNLAFAKDEVEYAVNQYRAGVSVPVMARRLDRKEAEVVVLLIDLAEKNRIKPRPGGIFFGHQAGEEDI